MDKVYLVSDGEYSDYRIMQAFSTRELAQEYVNECGGDIEEYLLDVNWREGIKNYKRGYLPFNIIYNISDNDYVATEWKYSTGDNYVNYCLPSGDDKTWTIRCLAKDGQHAVKIANERISQIKALNLINASFDDYWDIKFGKDNPYTDI